MLGQLQNMRIFETENVHAGEPNRAGHTIAVFLQSLKGRVPRFHQVHFSAGNQIVEIARGNPITLYGVGKSRKDGMTTRIARHRVIQKHAPTAEGRAP